MTLSGSNQKAQTHSSKNEWIIVPLLVTRLGSVNEAFTDMGEMRVEYRRKSASF